MKEKTTYFVTKKFVIGILLIVLCLPTLLYANAAQTKVKEAKNLSELTTTNLREGDYVLCSIDRYLAKHSGRSDRYSGIGDSLIGYSGKYCTYTVQLSDERYLRVKISDTDAVEALNRFQFEEVPDDQFTFGTGAPVTFYCVINKAEDANLSWYQDVENFDPNTVIANYVICETNVTIFGRLQIAAIAGLIFGVALIIVSGGIRKKAVQVSEYRPIGEQTPAFAQYKQPVQPAYFVAQNPSWTKTESKEEEKAMPDGEGESAKAPESAEAKPDEQGDGAKAPESAEAKPDGEGESAKAPEASEMKTEEQKPTETKPTETKPEA